MDSRHNRGLQQSSGCSSGLASVISIFCIGLVTGFPGGLLLGRTAVALFQSLELLVDNKLLVDNLVDSIMDYIDPLRLTEKNLDSSEKTSIELQCNTFISVFVEMFGIFCLTLSLAVGITVGLWTHELVTTKHGKREMGKALAVAGPVCVMGMTTTGYVLGCALESFLSITSNVSVTQWCLAMYILFSFCWGIWDHKFCYPVITTYLLLILTVYFIVIIFAFTPFLKTQLILIWPLCPPISFLIKHKDINDLLPLAPVYLIAILICVYNIVRQPIITLQSPANTSIVVLEGLFVGVLICQLLMVTIGMSVFVSWQRGGAGKICVSSVGLGGAVLAVVESVLPVLGPGPTIGALIGVAGTVGVSLSAAGAATDQYGEVVDMYVLVGRLGVTVGASVGAFLSSCAHSGLSAVFMGLCAAVICAGFFLKPLYFALQKYDPGWKFSLCLCTAITIFSSAWLYFAPTAVAAIILVLMTYCFLPVVLGCRCFPVFDSEFFKLFSTRVPCRGGSCSVHLQGLQTRQGLSAVKNK